MFQHFKRSFLKLNYFLDLDYELVSWDLALGPEQVRGLYSTFSSISRLAEAQRSRVLDQLAEAVGVENTTYVLDYTEYITSISHKDPLRYPLTDLKTLRQY